VKLLQELARQLGLSEQTIKKPMSEDQALGILADAVKTGKTVSKEDVALALDQVGYRRMTKYGS
jgi:biotin operon repressor